MTLKLNKIFIIDFSKWVLREKYTRKEHKINKNQYAIKPTRFDFE